MTNENCAQSMLEAAKNFIFAFSLEGWPAAATLILIPAAVVLIYAIKEFASKA